MSLNTTQLQLPGMTDLHSRIEDGDYSIEIKETRVGRLVTLNKGGERTLTEEEHEELTDLLSDYQDIILELSDAYHEDDDPHRSRWRMGKVFKEQIEESEHRDMDKLIPLLPFVDSKEYRQSYRIQLFYEVFPDKEWSEKEAPGTISELAQRAENPDEARQIYDENIRDADETLVRDEIRAWKDIRKEYEDPSLEKIVEKAVDRVRSPRPKTVRNIYRLFGRDDFPPDEEIDAAIEAVEEIK